MYTQKFIILISQEMTRSWPRGDPLRAICQASLKTLMWGPGCFMEWYLRPNLVGSASGWVLQMDLYVSVTAVVVCDSII